MKHHAFLLRSFCTAVTVIWTLASTPLAAAATLDALIDDFSHKTQNSLGFERHFVNDTTAGGQTQVQHSVDKGVFSAKGKIVPPRGQPGWASTVLMLDSQGLPKDASAFKGLLLRVRVNRGNLSVSANSSEITNFDYHAAVIPPRSDGEFQEVKIPFTQLKRAWSHQVPLNTKTLTSISLVAFDMQKASFDYEIEEVRFY